MPRLAPPPFTLPRRQSGITLIELMIGLVVMGILATLAIPSFQSVLASSRLTSASNELTFVLAQARSQAIRLGKRVTVCRSLNGTACANAATPGWDKGFIVFTDASHTETDPVVDSGDTITYQVSGLGSDIVSVGNSALKTYISFGADGAPKTMGGGMLFGTLRVCSTSPYLPDDARVRDLTLTKTGRIVVAKTRGIGRQCPTPS